MLRNLLGRLSLQTVFTVPIVTIVLVTVGLTSYLASRNGESAVNNLASQLHQEVTARIQLQLDAYLATPHLINQLNLDSIRLGQLDVQDLDGLQLHLLAQLKRFSTIIALGYGSESKDYVGPVRNYRGFDLGAGFAGASTHYALEGYGIDPQGNRLQLMASDANYDPRVRPWYEAAVQAGKETWVPIYMWSSGDVGLDAVAPVYDKDGKLLGVLDSSLTLNGIGDFLRNTNISAHGQMFIMERTGLLVASSTQQTPYTRSGDTFDRISALNIADSVVQSAARSITTQFGALTKVNQSQQFYFDLAGAPQFTQVTPYRDQYGLDWLIVTVIPESDFMAQIDANNRSTALVIAVSLLAALILTTWMTRWVTRPILRLNQSAKSIAQGDWTQKVMTNRSDEVGELAGSFNRMAEELQASYTSLQSSEEKYRALYENAIEGIFQSTPEGKFLSVNLALARMYGYESPADMMAGIGSIQEQLYVDSSRRAAFEKALEEKGRVEDFEVAHYRKDRSIIWISTNARAVRDRDGKVTFYEGFATDITDRKRVEEQREHLFRELRAAGDRQLKLAQQLMQAQETERRLIARELHDEIGQALTAVKINLQRASRPDQSNALALRLDENVQIVETVLRQVRNLSLDLRPSLLDDLGLVPALRWYVDRIAVRAGLTSNFAADLDAPRASPETETMCFRIAQEALTNVQRHAHAHHIQIELSQDDEMLNLNIQDDGIGFDVKAARERAAGGGSLGMLGMTERAELVGGELTIRSEPNHGTRVIARLPIAGLAALSMEVQRSDFSDQTDPHSIG